MPADSDSAKIAPIARQEPVNLPAFGDRGHCPVDESHTKLLELCVKFQRSGDIGREWQFIFIACRRIEYLGHQFTHRSPIRSKEIVYLRQNESGHDDGA